MGKSLKLAIPAALLAAGAFALPATPALADPGTSGTTQAAMTPAEARALAAQDPAFAAALRAAVIEKAQNDPAFRAELIAAIAEQMKTDANLREAIRAALAADPAFRAAIAAEMRRVAAANSSSAGQRIVQIARSRIGGYYTSGGEGPWGFDCSGLTQWVYAQYGVSLPHYSGSQAGYGTPVSLSNLRPGDLMFWGSGASRHAAIYSGNGMIIHAPSSRYGVVEQPLSSQFNYKNDYYGARRIV